LLTGGQVFFDSVEPVQSYNIPNSREFKGTEDDTCFKRRCHHFIRQTLIKSGLVLQHWPNLPVGKFGLKRGIVDTRTATASTNPFSVW